jgi:ABC transporter with metal-binding/Fe-S-binding domain ATP-binding protein
MRLAALVSGGKDSIYALMQAMHEHEVVKLVNIRASADSYMYHVPYADVTTLISEIVKIPIITRISASHEDELDVLESILINLNIDGIVAGAIASNYQMRRIKALCDKLELEVYAPLWNEGETLLRNMCDLMEIIIVQVAAYGMDKSWLGRRLDASAVQDLLRLNKRYRVHVMGEGGEYETLVLDAPIYDKRISIGNCKKMWFDEQYRGFLRISDFKLEEKRNSAKG